MNSVFILFLCLVLSFWYQSSILGAYGINKDGGTTGLIGKKKGGNEEEVEGRKLQGGRCDGARV